MKLISMVDFILLEVEDNWNGVSNYMNHTHNYAKFLKQPLTLSMFVPCDDEWNVLKKPKGYDSYTNWEVLNPKFEQYKQAQEKVLFKGFEVEKVKDYYIVKCEMENIWISWTSRTIESLLKFDMEFELTDNAIKQIQ